MAKKNASPFLPVMKKYARELNLSFNDLFVSLLRSMYAHVYYIWRTFKPSLGFEKGLETYGTVWDTLAIASFQAGMQELGLKEVKDLPTFGKIVQFCFLGVPALYQIKRNERDEHVGQILWCANPAYGPADARFDRNDYYRQEIHLTYTYLRRLVAEAKKAGLKEDVEIDLPSGRCRDGAACVCQIVLRTPHADKSRPLPEVPYQFIEEEMGPTEPILYILKQQKRSPEYQGPNTFVGFFYTDYLAWAGLEQAVPAKKAEEVYLNLWRQFPSAWSKDARLDLWMGKPETIADVANILAYCEKKKYMPYRVTQNNGTIILKSDLNPYVEVMNAFGFKEGCSYFKAVSKRDQDFISRVLQEVQADKRFKAVLTKAISEGDTVNQIDLIKK